ncbi:hypothetical protein BD770DRAFT_380194, partial [Pilaira anomala]
MTNHLNDVLPFEVLKKIFQNLNGKKDIKTCLSVCKSWQVAAREFFGEMLIKVDEDSLEKLLNDIVYFAQQVKSIILSETESTNLNRKFTGLVWYAIVLACPNLTSIKISVNQDYEYTWRLVNTSAKRLGHIQYFETSTSLLHLRLNLKYHKTITSLSIPSDQSIHGTPSKDDSVVEIASKFPKLTSIEIKGPRECFYSQLLYRPKPVDIIQLLEEVPHLQKIRVFQPHKIKSSSAITTTDNFCLTSLSLEVNSMDTNSLIFIAARLKQLNYLHLNIKHLKATNLSREQFNEASLFDDLISFTRNIPEYYVIYQYYHYGRYILQNGEEPRIERVSSGRSKYEERYFDSDDSS